MQVDVFHKQITVKLVYYGPAMSGKTTNLQHLHRLVDPALRGNLMALETRDDRTLFFDLLPFHFTSASGVRLRIKLFTVPGQVIHNATRRIVLQILLSPRTFQNGFERRSSRTAGRLSGMRRRPMRRLCSGPPM